MSTVRIDVSETLSEEMTALIGGLEGQGRINLNEAMGVAVQVVTVKHLQEIAHTRHATAERLGATPTGFWADAAEKVESPDALSAWENEAILSIPHPGARRAFEDVTITPTTAKALAIPIHAIAYGHRAAELWDAMALFIPKGTNVIAMKDPDGGILPLFALCRSVTQPQDRTLLPSDEEWTAAATEGAEKYVAEVLWRHGRL
jgi:hypothetical protein